MPTVKYLKDLQSHSKGDTAWLDANSAAEQAEMGVLEIVAEDEPTDPDEERETNTLAGVRAANEAKASKSKK